MRALIIAVLLVVPAIAHAYPQYQLAGDTTCTGCHVSPAGGRLLTENGLAVAQSIAWHDNDPGFLHSILPTPSWLQLGGDGRLAAGMVDPGAVHTAAYPMQADLYVSVSGHGVTLFLEGGLREASTPVWSREHYLMWQQRPGESEGLYVRVGRFSPVYGLRLAEHVAYTQRFGGDPIYGEAYGAAVEYVTHELEIHATGFVNEAIATAVEHGDGGALYAEMRIGEHAAVGAEAKYSHASELAVAYGGITGKVYLTGPKIMLLGEAEVVRRHIFGAGDTAVSAIGYVHASRSFPHGFMLDFGLGHYAQDTRIAGLYRDAVEADLHWFQTSHLEWLLTTRLELLDHGAGTNGGYVLGQIHYRL